MPDRRPNLSRSNVRYELRDGSSHYEMTYLANWNRINLSCTRTETCGVLLRENNPSRKYEFP